MSFRRCEMLATRLILRRKGVAEGLWFLFSAGNVVAILLVPAERETIPFHFVWLGLILLYGFRVWAWRATAVVLSFTCAVTGAALFMAVDVNGPGADELAEVPLMALMFIAIAWHARRARALKEEVARLAEREREFIGNVAHEVRTTITVARGHAELIRGTCLNEAAVPDRATLAEDAEIVIDELGRLAKVSSRLMLLASRHQPDFLNVEPIDLRAVTTSAVRKWRGIERRRWRVQVPEGTLLADAERLRAVLDALLENAVRHTNGRNAIAVTARSEDGAVVISVSDTGEGIPADQLPLIFDYRYSGAARRHRSTGLGLAIAKAIIEAHGGTVGAASILGKGTTFEIRLPGWDPAPDPRVEPVVRSKAASAPILG